MKEIIILIATGIGGLLFAFFSGKNSQKEKQKNERNANALKIVREVKRRSKSRDSDTIDDVKRRLRKNSRNR